MSASRLGLLHAITALALVSGCSDGGGPPPEQPKIAAAAVTKSDDGDPATLTLTAEAVSRLGILLVPAKRLKIGHTRTYAGEVVVPPGQRLAVRAPFTGTIRAPAGSEPPSPGARIEAATPVFEIEPLLSAKGEELRPLDRAQAERLRVDLETTRIHAHAATRAARARLAAAESELARTERLVLADVASTRAHEEAVAAVEVARAEMEAAVVVDTLFVDPSADADAAIELLTPLAGVLVRLDAAPGQVVEMGAPLFEVARTDPVWVRVPVPIGDVATLDPRANAGIGPLSVQPGAAERTAHPVDAPPSADAIAATVDVWFVTDNADGMLRPGERIGATLRLSGEDERLVVPWKAVLLDLHGSAWVYESPASNVFRRRRLDVERVTGEWAVIARGLAPGDTVVTDGAAELYGTEFGVGK